MADNYTFLGATATEFLIGAGKTQPGRMVSAQAQPSGAMFTLAIPETDYTPQKLGEILSTVADALNRSAATPNVTDINVYQDVNSSGQFKTEMTVGVVSTSGNSDETISLPYSYIFGSDFAGKIQAEVANMDAIEAL